MPANENLKGIASSLFLTYFNIRVGLASISILLPILLWFGGQKLTFLKSGAKANAYIAAWRYLNAERICYELDPTYTNAKLAEQHKKAEAIIGKAD